MGVHTPFFVPILRASTHHPMLYQITEIKFDCTVDDDTDYWSLSDQICTEEKLAEEYVGTVWEAEDGDDLIDEVSTASGWCILSIDYRHVLS
jgi:hypothetical protein